MHDYECWSCRRRVKVEPPRYKSGRRGMLYVAEIEAEICSDCLLGITRTRRKDDEDVSHDD